MVGFADWFGPLLAGVVFFSLGSLKLWGLRRGFEGGRGKPAIEYACGS